jgi:hypothetical protein
VFQQAGHINTWKQCLSIFPAGYLNSHKDNPDDTIDMP